MTSPATAAVTMAIFEANSSTAFSFENTPINLHHLQVCQNYEEKTANDNSFTKAWITTYFFLSPITVISNLLVIISIWSHRNLHTVTYSFIFNLAVADCLVGATMPLWSLFYIMPSLYFNEKVCMFMFITVFVSYICSVSTLLAIAFDRYIYITYPLHYMIIMTNRRAKFIIASIWTYSTLVGCLPLIFHSWNSRTKLHEEQKSFTVCVMECTLHRGYLTFLSIQFATLTAIILMLYIVIFKTAKSQKQKILEQISSLRFHHELETTTESDRATIGPIIGEGKINALAVSAHDDETDQKQKDILRLEMDPDQSHTKEDGRQDYDSMGRRIPWEGGDEPGALERIGNGSPCDVTKQSRRRVAKVIFKGRMDSELFNLTQTHKQIFNPKKNLKRSLHKTTSMVIILSMFIICWSPFHVLIVYNSVGRLSIDLLTARIAFLFAGIVNSAVNPLVYALRMKALRKAYKWTLSKCYSWLCFNQD